MEFVQIKSFIIGQNDNYDKYATLSKGVKSGEEDKPKCFIDIRVHFKNAEGTAFPTHAGATLTLQEYRELLPHFTDFSEGTSESMDRIVTFKPTKREGIMALAVKKLDGKSSSITLNIYETKRLVMNKDKVFEAFSKSSI